MEFAGFKGLGDFGFAVAGQQGLGHIAPLGTQRPPPRDGEVESLTSSNFQRGLPCLG